MAFHKPPRVTLILLAVSAVHHGAGFAEYLPSANGEIIMAKSSDHPLPPLLGGSPKDQRFHGVMWRVERATEVAMVLFIGAGLAGVFGSGPLSHATARDASGLMQVEYQRFSRLQTPTTLRLQLSTEAMQDGHAKIWINEAYLAAVQLRHIRPTPGAAIAGQDGTIFHFDIQRGASPAVVEFDLEPERPGSVHGQIRLNDGPLLEVPQFVYP